MSNSIASILALLLTLALGASVLIKGRKGIVSLLIKVALIVILAVMFLASQQLLPKNWLPGVTSLYLVQRYTVIVLFLLLFHFKDKQRQESARKSERVD